MNHNIHQYTDLKCESRENKPFIRLSFHEYLLTADIEGMVKGSLSVKNTLFLKSTSNIEGEVLIGKLTVESGATFNANCSMKSQEDKQIKPISKFL